MDVIYENIEEYNPNKKHKILIAFDGMIANILSNKKIIPITELFIKFLSHNLILMYQKILEYIQHFITFNTFNTLPIILFTTS